MKKLLLTSLACGALTSLLFAQTARVQIVHNSPDPAAEVVDIYVNDGDDPAVDNLAYRSATGFVDLPAGVELEIDITGSEAASSANPAATINYTFEDGKTYYLIADGILGDNFSAYVYDDASEDSGDEELTDLTIYHGSIDAGSVDVQETSIDATLADDFTYGQFTTRLALSAGDYYVEVRDDQQTQTVAPFDVPLAGGTSVLAVASGYAAPTGDQPALGLFAIPAAGGDFLPLDISTATAQIIHNSPVAGEVDIYVNDAITELVNVPFRFASSYVEIPVGLNQKLSVNLAGTGTEAIAANADIKANESYTVIAGGGANERDLALFINPMARMSSVEEGNTSFNVFHGATDAPAVDVTLTDGSVLVPNLAFGEYTDYLDLPTVNYVLQVRAAGTETVVETYNVALADLGLQGEGITVLASGYLAPEGEDDPAFGLYVATAEGGPLVMVPVQEQIARVQIVHNSPDPAAAVVDIYVNDGDEPAVDDLAYRTATEFVSLPAGVELELDITGSEAASSESPAATINYTFEAGQTYYLIADGILGDNFSAYVYDNAAEESDEDGNTGLTIYHGSIDAPTVDVHETSVDVTLADDLAYGEFSDRFNLTSDIYYAEIRDVDQTVTVAAYDVPLAAFDGEAVLAVASGYLASDDENAPAFGLFAVPVAGGDFLPLDASTATAQIIHNSPVAGPVDVYINGEATGLVDVPFRFASSYVEIPVGLNQEFSLNAAGTNTEAIAVNGDIAGGESYIMVAAGGDANQDLDIFIQGGATAVAGEDGNTDVAVFHGATDAPAVDITLTDGTALVEDLAFGDFDGYLELATDNYILQVRAAGTETVVETYDVALADFGLENQGITVLASGYLAPEGENDPAFGLYVALPAGGALVPLDVSVIDGINELAEVNANVYPNPTEGLVNLDKEFTSYEVINAVGSVVKSGTTQQIDISELPAGIYTISVIGDDFSAKARVIKK
ncbi:MAG: DUF4397 domain-containing protein [Cytophagales bacterium]|nr:DUF4397 domain-containing protein [Cytophagales bacterium]